VVIESLEGGGTVTTPNIRIYSLQRNGADAVLEIT